MKHATTDRLLFLDCVRTWCVLAVVTLHVAMSQLTFPWGWPVPESRHLIAANWLVVITSSFAIPVLFFIAGYFALPSLAAKGPGQFVRAKLWRLALPGAAVVIFLNPIYRYIDHVTHGFTEGVARTGYLGYWPRFFGGAWTTIEWRPGTRWPCEFAHLHIWFITVLLLFFLITAVIVWIHPQFADLPKRSNRSRPTMHSPIRTLILAALLACVGTLLISVRWRSDMVRIGPLLTCFPYDMPTHVVYYGLGLLAYRRQWFATAQPFGNVWGWLALCAVLAPVTCALFEWQLKPTHADLAEGWSFRLLSAVIWSSLSLSCFGLLVTTAQRFCHAPSRFHQHMAACSYRTYLLHLTVVVLVQLLLWSWSDLPGWLVLALGWVLSQAGAHLASVLVGYVGSRIQRLASRP